ncbi:chemotaxis protein CheW [Oleiagrimonas sp. C23AA]|uniref:chemotaxis protein CheW n=1 Tax=Oleiagrimonas sp. C23AA TaxID=2719047 RepID=UPI0031B671C1
MQQGQYLTFTIGGETFAVSILRIKEIIEYTGITTVPMMPDCIRGVINLRGAVVPVLDLALRLGRAASPVTKRTCVIIVEVQDDEGCQDMGIVVDAVHAVVDMSEQDIEPPPAFGARIRSEFIAGMGKRDGGFVIVLDLAHVLAQEELGALAGGTAQARAAEHADTAQ